MNNIKWMGAKKHELQQLGYCKFFVYMQQVGIYTSCISCNLAWTLALNMNRLKPLFYVFMRYWLYKVHKKLIFCEGECNLDMEWDLSFLYIQLLTDQSMNHLTEPSYLLFLSCSQLLPIGHFVSKQRYRWSVSAPFSVCAIKRGRETPMNWYILDLWKPAISWAL